MRNAYALDGTCMCSVFVVVALLGLYDNDAVVLAANCMDCIAIGGNRPEGI